MRQLSSSYPYYAAVAPYVTTLSGSLHGADRLRLAWKCLVSPSPRRLSVLKLRFVLPLVVLALAVTAGSANAVARMPVGFFDDPSFRWSEDAPANLLEAQRAHASIV